MQPSHLADDEDFDEDCEDLSHITPGWILKRSVVYGNPFPSSLGLQVASGRQLDSLPEAIRNHFSASDSTKALFVEEVHHDGYGRKMGLKSGDILITKSSSTGLQFGTLDYLKKHVAAKRLFVTYWLRPPPLEMNDHEDSGEDAEEEWEEERLAPTTRAVTPEQVAKRGRGEVQKESAAPPSKRPRELDTASVSEGGNGDTADSDSDRGASSPDITLQGNEKDQDDPKVDSTSAGGAMSNDEAAFKLSSQAEAGDKETPNGQDQSSVMAKKGENINENIDSKCTTACVVNSGAGGNLSTSVALGRTIKLEDSEESSRQKDGKGTEDNPIILEDNPEEGKDDGARLNDEDPLVTMDDDDDKVVQLEEVDQTVAMKTTTSAKPPAFDKTTFTASGSSDKALPSLSPPMGLEDKSMGNYDKDDGTKNGGLNEEMGSDSIQVSVNVTKSSQQVTVPSDLSLETLIQRALDGDNLSPFVSQLSSFFDDQSCVTSYIYEFGLVNVMALIKSRDDSAKTIGWSLLNHILEMKILEVDSVVSILVKHNVFVFMKEFLNNTDSSTGRDSVLSVCLYLCSNCKIFLKSWVACEGSFTCLAKVLSQSLKEAEHFDMFIEIWQDAESGLDKVAESVATKEDAATNLTNLLDMAQRYSQHPAESIKVSSLVASLQLVEAILIMSSDTVKQTFVNKEGLTIIFHLRHKFGDNSELKEAAGKAMQAAL
jgi:hypothetical protein